MKKLEAWTIAVVFTALIAIPVIAFASGARPEPNQNRPPTPLPDISMAGVFDRELTPQVDAYLEDALIIAPGAVAAEAWADVAIGDSPSDDVTLGTNGWLYFTPSLSRPCFSDEDVTRLVDTIERAQRAVAATGRELLVAVAPDKATIVPDYLPDIETCVQDNAHKLENLQHPDRFITVWEEMRKARAKDRPIYFRLDTHWTGQGAAVMAEAIIEELRHNGWNEEALRAVDTVDHEGDLTVILGLPSSEPTDELESALPNTDLRRTIRNLITAAGNEYQEVVAVDFTVDGDPIVPGHTLVMHDSYGWALTPLLAPYFESVSMIAESSPAAGHMARDLADAETVVYQIVQRSVQALIASDLAAHFVAGYADHFPVAERGTRQTGERLELDPATEDSYLVVELSPGTEAAEAAYNDITVKLTADSPRGAFYIRDGGTVFFAGEVDYRVVSVDS